MYYLNFTTSILLQKYFKKALHIVHNYHRTEAITGIESRLVHVN